MLCSPPTLGESLEGKTFIVRTLHKFSTSSPFDRNKVTAACGFYLWGLLAKDIWKCSYLVPWAWYNSPSGWKRLSRGHCEEGISVIEKEAVCRVMRKADMFVGRLALKRTDRCTQNRTSGVNRAAETVCAEAVCPDWAQEVAYRVFDWEVNDNVLVIRDHPWAQCHNISVL